MNLYDIASKHGIPEEITLYDHLDNEEYAQHVGANAMKAQYDELLKGLVVEWPKKNMLPLELKYCEMEIYRKNQDLAPLFNEIRNETINECKQALKKVGKENG